MKILGMSVVFLLAIAAAVVLFSVFPRNVFLLKVSYWLGR